MDDRIRELERRWRESGATDSEVAHLFERVRAGTLSEERLRVLHRPIEAAVGFQFGPSEWDFENEHHDINYEAYEEARREFATEPAWHAYSVLRLIRNLPDWSDVSEATGVLMTVLDGVNLDAAVAAIRKEVLPWLVSDSDPIRERVEAREREAASE